MALDFNAVYAWEKGKKASIHLMEVGDDDVRQLAEVIDESSQKLESLTILLGDDWGTGNLKLLMDALAKHPEIGELKLQGKMVGFHASVIADGLKALPNLEYLDLSHNQIGAAGANAVAKAVEQHPSLLSLTMENNIFGPEAVPAFCSMIRHNPNLAEVNLAVSGIMGEGERQLGAACRESPNGNLIMVVPITVEPSLGEPTRTNTSIAKLLFKETRQADFASLSPAILNGVLERSNGLRHYAERFEGVDRAEAKELVQALVGHIDSLPSADASKSPDELISPADERGYTPLDNPRVWKNLPAVAGALKDKGTPLTKTHLQQKNRFGQSHFEAGAEMGYMPEMVATLNAAGERILPEDLLNENGSPNDAFIHTLLKDQVSALFTHANWRGAHPSALSHFVNELPYPIRDRVPNTHALSATLRREQTLLGRSR